MKCDKCNDTGIVLTRREVQGLSGKRTMREPGFCPCEAGDQAVHKYEQNLKSGRAGMYGLYPTDTGSVT